MELCSALGALLALTMMIFRAMRCTLTFLLLWALYLSVYKVGTHLYLCVYKVGTRLYLCVYKVGTPLPLCVQGRHASTSVYKVDMLIANLILLQVGQVFLWFQW